MATPDRGLIETFMSITSLPESIAVQKLEEHGFDINEAVNAHFNHGDRNILGPLAPESEDDFMDIDDPVEMVARESISEHPSAARTGNSFSILDPNHSSNSFGQGSDPSSDTQFVSPPIELRQIRGEGRDINVLSGRSFYSSTVEDEGKTEPSHSHYTIETAINDDDLDILASSREQIRQRNEQNPVNLDNSSFARHVRPSAPSLDALPDDSSDIEEEMIRVAIEASKQGQEEPSDPTRREGQPQLEEADLTHAVTLSLQTAEEERLLREKRQKVRESGPGTSKDTDVELQQIETSNGRLEAECSSFQGEARDMEEQALVRNTTRLRASGSAEQPQNYEDIGADQPANSLVLNTDSSQQSTSHSALASDEWGGISPAEHDEAVMLEAAMFGGIPESRYRSAYTPHRLVQPDSSFADRAPDPPSPSAISRRLIREQQDDEYHQSLQADREKEMKAMREAEARRLEEEAAKEAAREEKRQKEEEARRKMEVEQELERQLGKKEASLPREPATDEENAITLLVRMPDGSRRGRRFMKSDKLQSLFDFIDIGRSVKPGSYRMVRPYPRQAFGDRQSGLTLNELGLSSKQEALFLELI